MGQPLMLIKHQSQGRPLCIRLTPSHNGSKECLIAVLEKQGIQMKTKVLVPSRKKNLETWTTLLTVSEGTTTIFAKRSVLILNAIYDFGISPFFSLISFRFFFWRLENWNQSPINPKIPRKSQQMKTNVLVHSRKKKHETWIKMLHPMKQQQLPKNISKLNN